MPRNKYPEETVKKILDVSQRLFLEKGYEETTVLDIVDNLGGLTRGAFYHHFKSKEEVLDALGDRMFFDNNPFERVKSEPGLTGLEKIRKVFKLQFENADTQKFNMMSLPLLKNPRILVDFMESNQKVIAPMLRELIEEGMADGSIPDTGYQKPMSELIMLITDVWFSPSVFPCSKEELQERLYFVKGLLEKIGIPIIDDEILNYAQNSIDVLELEQQLNTPQG